MSSRERWDGITTIQRKLDALSDADVAFSRGARRKGPAFHETAEWRALCDELRALSQLEANAACKAGWPVWQETQHFSYLRGSELREGAVVRFDREAGTVDADTWEFEDVIADIRGDTIRETIRIDAIIAGERRRREHDDREAAEAVAVPVRASKRRRRS